MSQQDRIHDDMPAFPDLVKIRLNQMIEGEGAKAKDVAEKLGIPAPTLSRYRKAGCQLDSSHAKAILAIIEQDPDRYGTLMEHYYPVEAKVWRNMYGNYKYSGVKRHMAAVDFVERDALNYYIYAFAGLDKGLPLEAVHTCWGKLGMERVQDFVNAGLLSHNEDYVVRENKNVTYGDLNTVKKCITHLAQDYPVKNIYKKEGMMANLINGLNERGIQVLRERGIEAASHLLDVFHDPEFKGDIPVSATVLVGKMKFSDEYDRALSELEAEESEGKEKKNDK